MLTSSSTTLTFEVSTYPCSSKPEPLVPGVLVLGLPDVAAQVLMAFRQMAVDEDTQSIYSPLSPRELQVLELVAAGRTNKEIAVQLDISNQTVKNHVSSILRKLAVNDRTQAVVYAMRRGWIKVVLPGD